MGVRENHKNQQDRISFILFTTHAIFLLLAVVILIRICWIICAYKPMPEIVKYLKPGVSKEEIDPKRGSIMAQDGRYLAISTPMYRVFMDCTVRKDYYKNRGDVGKKEEAEWLKKAQQLSNGLAKIYRDRSPQNYYKLIRNGRRDGQKYQPIGYKIDHETLQKVKSLPLFNEGQYKGGIIVVEEDSRIYPFGSLARRTIGYINNNNSNNNHVGLEGKYFEELRGQQGYEWKRVTDNHGKIHNFDSTSVKVVDGNDIRTTLDIDIQDIADKALRNRIDSIEEIEGGCCIVMDVKTGGIRAMVNLKRDSNGRLSESYNYAIGQAGDPGSVFKLTTLMTLLEDGKTSLESKIPTFYGKWSYNGHALPDDDYLYKSKHPENRISVIDGLKISSNHVFRYLACENYVTREEQEHFIEKISDYGLNEVYDFDLIGMAKPQLQKPGDAAWSGTSLPSIAIGYSVTETPLHIVSFYNAIAAGGKMMKPYLVEDIEYDGKVIKEMGPKVLKKKICSKATADTLTRALRKVVTEGTGSRLKHAACPVAGKTGTARIAFPTMINGRERVVYKDREGNKKHQGTFVGFFPADNPKYTAIVVVYSQLGKGNFYGGSYAAPVLNEIVNKVYALDHQWGDRVQEVGEVPNMKAQNLQTTVNNMDIVPNVKGLGLSDALYAIENCGYKCSYEGIGHVRRQDPVAGTHYGKGKTIKIILE